MTSCRHFIVGLGATALGAALSARRSTAAASFNVSVLTDEISQDFGHACEVASGEFGLGWVELRAMHSKNGMNWDANDIAEVRKVLERFTLRVSEIASPVFKTDWPGAPKSPFSPKNPQFGADFTYAGAVSLETHWRLQGGTAEESTRQSLAGMKELLRKA